MSYVLSARSKARLVGVHPNLVKVVEKAITITEVDFSVVQGTRTLAKQREYFNLGKSKTMRSRHIPECNACRLSCAVDLAPWINGTISWEPEGFAPVSVAMKKAAHYLNISLEWGGDWHTFIDMPHFQLPWGEYT